MTNYHLENHNFILDFDSFSEVGIELSPEQIAQAQTLSDRMINPERQWQTYLNALAFLGFQTWLSERDSSLVVKSDRCSVMEPNLANYLDGVFNIAVGNYKICLLTNGVGIDEFVNIDRALVELSAYVSHFYVLVNVIEERAEVEIASFISYQELKQRQQSANLTPDADWTYQVPLTWFNPEPDDLLLCLRCLDSRAIPLPSPVEISTAVSVLESLIPQLQSGEPLAKVITWEQAIPILSNPHLWQWLYELQTTKPTVGDALTALNNRLSNTVAEIAQTAINVRSWLANELDALAQNLAWTLLPPVTAPSGLRNLGVSDRQSPAIEFEAIITQLRNNGEDIPLSARGACRDFNLESHEMRLFVVTWEVAETQVPEWSLLLVLGAQADNYLPQGLKLEVKETDTVLDEKIVAEDTADSYIYTQVIGELTEQFTVSINLTNGASLTFPNFVFD